MDATMEHGEAERIVRLLYEHVLSRKPGEEEFQLWKEVLLRGAPISGVIDSFGTCDEHRKLREIVPFFPPGHYYSPIVNPDESVRAYMLAQRERVGSARLASI